MSTSASGADKAELRRRYLELRRSLSAEAVAARSASLMALLEDLPCFHEAGEVLAFVASKDNEPDTRPLIARLLAADRRVLAPIAKPRGALAWGLLRSMDDLAPSRFGILEPAPERTRVVEPDPRALVIVPGVVFSRDGYRIGYGAGYYDRFLAGCKGFRVGVAFQECVIDALPVEAHDVPVDLIVTDCGILEARVS